MDSAAFDSALRAALVRWELPIEAGRLELLRAHFARVVEANKVMNLTRITEPTEAAIKHYADCLALLLWCRDRRIECRTVLDVGTGAGFPAVPLAVMRPDWTVTAIDATGKKVDFLRDVAAELKLTNLRVEHAHSVHWRPGRSFDLVVFRALTRLDRALKQCQAHVSPVGRLVGYTTEAAWDAEFTQSDRAASPFEIVERFEYDLFGSEGPLRRELAVLQRSNRSQRERVR